MRLDELPGGSALRKALDMGERRMSEVVGKLLASERFTNGLQSLVSSALHVRQKVEKGVSRALHAANLPSKEDVAALGRKLDELESAIDGLARRARRGGKEA
jgi:hypothetical protein